MRSELKFVELINFSLSGARLLASKQTPALAYDYRVTGITSTFLTHILIRSRPEASRLQRLSVHHMSYFNSSTPPEHTHRAEHETLAYNYMKIDLSILIECRGNLNLRNL